MKRIAFVLGMALALPLAASEPAKVTAAAPPRSELTLSQAFDLAWQRQPAAQALPGRQAQSRAESELAAAWTPSAPKVTLGTLPDRYNDRAGWREWEAELAVPLWLPGQRDAQQALAQSQQALVGLQAGAQRLELAGMLRDAWWRLAAAANASALAQGRLDWANALLVDVDRRWRAGELPRTDANVARAEAQVAESESIEARNGERQAANAWRALTGVAPPTSLPEEAPAAAAADPVSANPRLLAINAAIARARARAHLQDKSAREAPELTLRVLREQSNSAEPWANAVGVKISIPFSSGPRLASEGAGVAADLAEAEAQALQLREQLQLDAEAARLDLQAADHRLALARTRAELAADTLALVQRAFTLGEADLATLLRARAAASDADAERGRQRIARASAISQLNQVIGVLP